jgi:hypothetical protein
MKMSFFQCMRGSRFSVEICNRSEQNQVLGRFSNFANDDVKIIPCRREGLKCLPILQDAGSSLVEDTGQKSVVLCLKTYLL